MRGLRRDFQFASPGVHDFGQRSSVGRLADAGPLVDQYYKHAVSTLPGLSLDVVFDAHASQPLSGDSLINRGQRVATLPALTTMDILRLNIGQREGMIRFLGTSLTNFADWNSVTWHVLISDGGVPGFATFDGPISAGLGGMLPVRFDLVPGSLFVVRATNTSGIDIMGVAARAYGWCWSPNLGGPNA